MGRFSRCSVSPLIGALVGALSFSGCDLLNTSDDENVAGRGPVALDPYAGDLSTVIKLGLQQFNGCAIKATGEPLGPGAALIPYPDSCENFQEGVGSPAEPGEPLPVLTGTRFFVDKLSFVQVLENVHTNPDNMQEVASWMANDSNFAALDWTGLTITRDRWVRAGLELKRQVEFGGAAWQLERGQTFLLELLDASGTVRATREVVRETLIADNEVSGHTRLLWEGNGIGTPQFPGDTSPELGPDDEPVYMTILRIEFAGSSKPFDTLDIPEDITGDGAIRVTWSAMPGNPFFFPVRFVDNDELDQTCVNAAGEPVGCRYGLDSEVAFTYPEGRDYYLPGDTVIFNVSLKDSVGNYLHPASGLPSYADYFFDSANGLLYFSDAHSVYLREADTSTMFKLHGPVQAMVPSYTPESPWFEWPRGHVIAPSVYPYFWLFPGAETTPLATRYRVPLPEDVQEGTYKVQVKAHRAWMGERVAKLNAFEFRVGDVAPTEYPGRVGNCQICHRGVLSLDNLRHGANVDEVEGCKSCHGIPLFSKLFGQDIHNIHQNAADYTQPKNDCSVCHLTRESATRPSFAVCSSCHPGFHGNEYFELGIVPEDSNPGPFGNCAQACHQTTPPTRHILPAP